MNRCCWLLGRCLLVYEFIITTNSMFDGTIVDIAAAIDAAGIMPEPMVYTGMLMKLAGSLSILLGFRVRLAALLLVIFTVTATLAFHDYWNLVADEVSPLKLRHEQHSFAKNVCITGGLLLLAAVGPGRFSIDHFLARRTDGGLGGAS